MTDYPLSALGAADPTTEAYWAACAERRLTVQRCGACGAHQHYPRPFCLACDSDDLTLVAAGGRGRIYALTTLRLPVVPELPPPYLLALVDLEEGPRLLTNIAEGPAAIGDPVVLQWRDRADGLPPLPVFRVSRDGAL
ncbi:MAG: hypothetical protein Kilf2KO_11060 [Rhodospirillales bacterium]